MLPEGTKTCKLCGHVLWREEEKEVCIHCQHDWHTITQAFLEFLPNKRAHLTATADCVAERVDESGWLANNHT